MMTDFCQVAGNVTLFNKVAQTVSIAKTELRGFDDSLTAVNFLGIIFVHLVTMRVICLLMVSPSQFNIQ